MHYSVTSQQAEVTLEWQVYLGVPCLASGLHISGLNVSEYHRCHRVGGAVGSCTDVFSETWEVLGEGTGQFTLGLSGAAFPAFLGPLSVERRARFTQNMENWVWAGGILTSALHCASSSEAHSQAPGPSPPGCL